MSALIDDMKALESAEDFFAYFSVPYDAAVVHVSRLHILKRFYQYLAQRGGLEGLPAAEAQTACREMLARAYEDFVASCGVEQKVFKVFQTARGEHRVAVGGLRRAAG
ncbi:nitrogenase stabilizing/protective protein NifW [Azoarcus sp. KH32C]|uniref:nitrogenase stabilizing/protective protein NifW n=1 Tax=Azoarcus sp. KH32C TaxID=748247 RepID=UPI00023865AC|nr:nitrogenase stabilizing/protective protein NifW [Azoarcus sp. KH32C]BAL23113.1 nitrogen fixation protein [Azoarcus sp. KH32C]